MHKDTTITIGNRHNLKKINRHGQQDNKIDSIMIEM